MPGLFNEPEGSHMYDLIMFVLGSIGAFYVLSNHRKYFKWLALACAGYWGLLYIGTSLDLFYCVYGVAAGYVAFNALTVFILPLLGKWRPFTQHYVVRGTVVDANTVVSHTGEAVVSPGFFGNNQVTTYVTSTNHDSLHLQRADGSLYVIHGVDLRQQAKMGDEVLVAGRPGQSHFAFENRTRNQRWTERYPNRTGALLTGLAGCIPGLGLFVLGINLIASEFVAMNGAFCKKPMEFELAHMGFAAAYQILAAAAFLLIASSGRNAWLSAAVWYGIIVLGFMCAHMIIWQKDYDRYKAFLFSKIDEN